MPGSLRGPQAPLRVHDRRRNRKGPRPRHPGRVGYVPSCWGLGRGGKDRRAGLAALQGVGYHRLGALPAAGVRRPSIRPLGEPGRMEDAPRLGRARDAPRLPRVHPRVPAQQRRDGRSGYPSKTDRRLPPPPSALDPPPRPDELLPCSICRNAVGGAVCGSAPLRPKWPLFRVAPIDPNRVRPIARDRPDPRVFAVCGRKGVWAEAEDGIPGAGPRAEG
eukprot:385639_1